jgi:hypothetical protein
MNTKESAIKVLLYEEVLKTGNVKRPVKRSVKDQLPPVQISLEKESGWRREEHAFLNYGLCL